MRKARIRLLLFFVVTLFLLAAANPSRAAEVARAAAQRVCRGDAGGLAAAETGAYFANCVPEDGYNAPGTIKPEHSNPANALGAPDVDQRVGRETWVALGNSKKAIDAPDEIVNPRQQCEGYLILEWAGLGFVDGEGEDLSIFEVGTNTGSGIVEPAYVYVSEDDDEYYYVGVIDSANKGSFDLQDIGPRDAVYHYMALCDVPDGVTSSNGPDIDAVAVFYGKDDGSGPVPVAGTVQGEGATLNDQVLADGEIIAIPYVPYRATIKRLEGAAETVGVAWKAYCEDDEISWFGWLLRRSLLRSVIKLIDAQCPETRAGVAMRSSYELALEDGGMALDVSYQLLDLTIETAVVSVMSAGQSRFDIDHDEAANETAVWAKQGLLEIAPTNGQAAPFQLNPGYRVVITADQVSAPFADTRSYVPVIRGD